MAYRRTPFALGEWYHLYNQGIEKRNIFLDENDFKRFQALLYLANNTEPVNFELLKNVPREAIFTLPRAKTLVAIGAYCLMTNHPHVIVQEKEENGITAFMHKLGTAYTTYFNRKHERIGNLMVKPFRSKHIADEGYLRRAVQYVHLNPAELFEPGWKNGRVRNMKTLEQNLVGYTFSSLPDYFGGSRPEQTILDKEAKDLLLDGLPRLRDVLNEAALYYEEIENEFIPHPRGRPIKAL